MLRCSIYESRADLYDNCPLENVESVTLSGATPVPPGRSPGLFQNLVVSTPPDLADPMPEPPPPPDFDACCGNGCNPCIFDLHDLAMDAYRRALRAWRERHPDAA